MQICIMPSLLPIKGNISVSGFKSVWYQVLYHVLMALRNTGDPCLGLPTPVAWHPTAEGIDMSFQPSKALAGCLDSTMPFQRVDDHTWKGRSSRGTEVTFTRKPPG